MGVWFTIRSIASSSDVRIASSETETATMTATSASQAEKEGRSIGMRQGSGCC